MTRREEVITQILERYDELVAPSGSSVGPQIRHDGDSVPQMPRTYTATVREIERLLVRMREERRSQWWHVTHRYIRCSTVTRDVRVDRRTSKGKTVRVVERRAVVVYDKAVRLEKVRRGVRWMADEWGLSSEPMLPSELAVAA